MDRHIVETTLQADGTVVLDDLPFQPGETVKITVIKQVPDDQPLLDQDKPESWENANPSYWIRVAAERISQSFDPEQIILFGSHATDRANAHSDIDLLVIFKEIENKHEQAGAIRHLLSDFPIAKDVIVATEQDIKKYGNQIGTVLRPALQEGKIIYERLR
ncbi:MAG: nucleotidyltransferase domain-containing protein [Cyanobacteria bacterium J06623_5]